MLPLYVSNRLIHVMQGTSCHSQCLLYVRLNSQWRGSWAIATDGVPLLINKELCEVPFYPWTQKSWFTCFEELIDRCCVRSIDSYLLEDRVFSFVSCTCKFLCLLTCSGFLFQKLVAWKSQDLKTLVFVFVVKFSELGVVGIREPTFGGNVNNEKDLPFVRAQVNVLPSTVLDGELVDRLFRDRLRSPHLYFFDEARKKGLCPPFIFRKGGFVQVAGAMVFCFWGSKGRGKRKDEDKNGFKTKRSRRLWVGLIALSYWQAPKITGNACGAHCVLLFSSLRICLLSSCWFHQSQTTRFRSFDAWFGFPSIPLFLSRMFLFCFVRRRGSMCSLGGHSRFVDTITTGTVRRNLLF